MNRHLHNSSTALLACSVLAFSLLTVATGMRPPSTGVASQRSDAAQAAPTIADIAPDKSTVVEASSVSFQDNARSSTATRNTRSRAGKSNRMRQSMAMPFFSFAPRG